MSYIFRTALKNTRTTVLPESVPEERRVNGICYTAGGLTAVFTALLMAGFGFNLLTTATGTLLPVQFKDMGADNETIALLLASLPSLLFTVVNPIASFRSDRTRTRWGRRMPYLFITVPFITLSVIYLGFGGKAGDFLDPLFGDNSQLAALTAGIVIYTAFLAVPNAVFWYVFPDVLPRKYIGRFMSLFNVAASASAILFNRCLLPFSENHLTGLYCVIAFIFCGGMFVMFLTVREGQYPPPPVKESSGIIKGVVCFFRECFGIPFYYPFFLAMALSDVSIVCRGLYNLIYAKDILGISVAEYGSIMAWGSVVGLVLCFPLGYICDKVNPLLIFGFGLLTVVIVNGLSYFFVHDYTSFFITTIALSVVYTIQLVSTIPVFVEILPKSLYGQFSSASVLFRSGAMFICSYGGGKFIDWTGNYQNIYSWDFIFTLLSLILFALLYRNWKKRGGRKGYTAPVPRCSQKI